MTRSWTIASILLYTIQAVQTVRVQFLPGLCQTHKKAYFSMAMNPAMKLTAYADELPKMAVFDQKNP